ncbi:GreA/GreB family elongation factor [Piscinibacter sp. XHJ-5]|uniref:GreA/GreB family elongation factor n=1 Tax=Piscinibacter sp. XHJ-5 TaxID=3037797 RepID=UPI002452ABDA|nr:GreA/GreB family elongation factor [Piscinibacter sp. XHJ-5]
MEVLALERTLTELDHARLSRLMPRDARSGSNAHPIESILEWARLVPSRDISPDIVTMYSQIVLGLPGGRQKKLTLCYPQDAEPSEGFVSVLSPAGSGLLGLRVGDRACWRTPTGGESAAEVLAILFQPEASGDYTT